MAISDNQKVDYLWKKIGYAAAKTDTEANKQGPNESIPSPLIIRGDKIMANSASIPGTIPGSNTGVVTVHTTSLPAELTNDATSSTNRTWLTNLTDWISPEFGSTYQAKVYISPSGQAGNVATKGTQVFATGSGNNDEWFFDYQAGVLNFIGNNLPSVSFTGNSVYVSAARYTGQFGYPNVNLGDFLFQGNTITSIQANGNIVLDAPGTGIVQINGSDAFGLPAGDDTTRPLSPEIGYTRFNTTRQSIEYWDGNTWLAPGAATISSETIYPDGASNVFTLGSNTSVDGILVSINGTLQQPIYSYDIVNNNQIQFTEIPLTTDIVEVRFISVSATTVSALRYGSAVAVVLDVANVNVTGNILPTANVTYSLGSAEYQWKDLWVSSNTIYIGGSSVTITNGQLTVGGNSIAPPPYGNANVIAYTESMGFKNYSNVNVAALITTNGLTNYSNVNVAALITTNGLTNYSNVNIRAYLGSSDITVGGNITVNGAEKRIIGDFNNVLPEHRTLFQASSTGSTSVGIISNGGPYAELMVYSNASTQGGAGAIQAFEDEVRIKTYNYGNVTEIPMNLYVGNQPVVTLGTDYSTTLSGNLVVHGNLFVNGNVTTINANNLVVNDSLIYLADSNPSNILDIGIVGSFTSGSYQHTGLVRDASDGVWKLFANVVSEPTTTVDFTNAIYSDLLVGGLTTNSTANVNSLALTVTEGTIPDWGMWRFDDGDAKGIALVSSGVDHIYLEEGIGTTFTQPTVAADNLTVNGTLIATNTITGNISGSASYASSAGSATTANNASYLGGAPAEACQLGYGQTWQNVSGSRSSGVTYTNSTARPIFISVRWDRDDGTLELTVDGLMIGRTGQTAGPVSYTLTAIVPIGSTYSATTTGSGGTLYWHELR